VMSTFVCVCLSVSISLEPHTRPLAISLYMLPVARSSPCRVTKSQGGRSNFGGCSGHSKALAIFAAAVAFAFAAKGIIQSLITSCSRRDDSPGMRCANRKLENTERAMRPIGREGGDISAQRGRSLISTTALL